MRTGEILAPPDLKRSNTAEDGNVKPSHPLEGKGWSTRKSKSRAAGTQLTLSTHTLTRIQGTVEDNASFAHGARHETPRSCELLGSTRPFYLHVGVAEIAPTVWEMARIRYFDGDGSGP